MIGKNNSYLKSVKNGTKVESYSIKKFKIGAASVVIGAGIFFGMGAIDSNEVKAADEGNKITENSTVDKDKKVEQPPVEKATLETTNTEKKLEETPAVSTEKSEAPVVASKEKAESEVKDISKTTPLPVENTEPKEGTNSIPNSGSRDPRNGKSMGEARSDFRADGGTDGTDIEKEEAEFPKIDKATLSADDQKNHYKKFQDETTKKNKDLEMLNKQLFFIDWSDTSAVTNIGADVKNGEYEGKEIKVGTTWTKEITPGYIVTVKVKELKNILGEENGVRINPGSPKYEKIKKEGGNPDELYAHRLVAYKENYNGYSAVLAYGLNAPGNTAVSGEIHLPGHDQGPGELLNVGVTFEISAEYRGRKVKPAFFVVSAEEAGYKEVEKYKTNGKGWELLTELMNEKVTSSFEANDKGWMESLASDMYRMTGYDISTDEIKEKIKILTEAISNNKITKETISVSHPNDNKLAADGLGTQVFGPVSSKINGKSVPILVTRGATEISAYLVTAGGQALSFGVLALDEGDASSSYGDAMHTISIGRNKDAHHPYIGKTVADLDEKDLETTKPSWTRDGVTDDKDEGPGQLMGDNVVKGANNEDYYTLHKVNEGVYELKIDAYRGEGNEKSYVRGWIDFNNNGVFDDDEASELVTVTQDGVQTLRFTNKYQNVDTSVENLGMRVRTALADHNVANPTGYAFSGEVEDFKIQQTLPPRGEKKQTIDVQGEKQSTKIVFNAYGKKDYDFNTDNAIDTTIPPKIYKLDGTEVKESELQDGYYVVAGEGKYKVTAAEKDVDIEFIPEENFTGKAKGIIVRRTDINKSGTGWGKIEGRTIVGGEGENGDIFNVNSAPTNTMDGYYVPIVTPKAIVGTPDTNKDLQKNPQKKTLIFKNQDGTEINPTGIKKVYSLKGVGADGKVVVYKDAEKKEKAGEYSIDSSTGEVTFTPDSKFTGIAPAATVVLTITPENMDKDASLTEDDKKALTKTAEATFTPEVVGAVPEGKNATTKDIQGQPQTAKILLDTKEETDDTATVNFDKGSVTLNEGDAPKFVDLDLDTLIMLDGDKEVTEMDAKAGDKVVGKYKLDKATKTITFTPNKDYDGKTPVTPATLRILDINGGEARATYTPEVVAVTPTAEKATTKDIQGETQTAPIALDTKEDPTKENTINFDKGSVKLAEGGEDKVVELDPETLTLMNGKDAALEVDAMADGNKVGTFKLDKESKTVIFTPNKDYTGDKPVDPVTIRIADKNGTEVTTTYTPTVVAVTPTAEKSETEGVQGEKQTSKVVFNTEDKDTTTLNFAKGSVTINEGEEPKSVDLDLDTLTLLDGDKEVATLTVKDEKGVEVGTYTIDKEKGEVVFQPVPTFEGKAPSVNVQIKDKNGTKVTTTYTPTVIAVTITPKDDASTKVQGLTQSGKPTFTFSSDKVTIKDYKLVDPKDNSPKDEVVIEGKGKYKVAADGTVTFIPEPNYVGVASIDVVATDSLGRPTKAKYTPTTTPLEIQASDIETIDIQGEKQSESPRFLLPTNKDTEVKEGTKLATFTSYKLIDPSDNTKVSDKVEIKGVGSYEIDKDGKVTFTPEKTYKGEVPTFVGVRATLTIVNEEGTTHTLTKDAKYTPKVVAAAPTVEPKETKDIQGAIQTGKPDFKAGSADVNGVEKEVPLDDTAPAKLVDDKGQDLKLNGDGEYIVENVGKYKVAADGTVTFIPLPNYVGKADGVLVRRVDKNGTAVDGKYTPTVVGVAPTATPAETEDVQGMTQTSPIILDKKEEADNKATVNFDKGTVADIKDENGNLKTVDLDETTLTLLDGNNEVTELDAKAGGEVVGKYILDKDKKEVRFVPTLEYDGTTPVEAVTIQIKDKNGTKVTTTYTPKVVAVKLNSKEATSTGVQGAKQTGTPTFTTDNNKVTFENYTLLDPKTKDPVDKVVIANEGTYTIDKGSGEVTFIPEAGYVTEKDKEATGVTVRAIASNKLTKDEKYTPKVTEVVAEGNKKETVGKQGATQMGTPDFTISDESHVKDENGKVNVVYSLEGADNEGKVVVENEGTYSIDANSGEVTFKPLLSYVTKDGESAKGVKVKATYTLTSDKDGEGKVTTSTIEALGEYVPKVTPVTLSHEDSSSTGLQGKTQTGTPTFSADDKEVTFTSYELVGADSEGKVVVPNEGTYTIDKETGVVSFIPEASYITEKDKKATGVTVRATSSNTLTEDAKYIPQVIGIEVTPKDTHSIDIQGAKQTGTPTFTIKDENKVNVTEKTYSLKGADSEGKVVVENEGTYTIDPSTGEVTFEPLPNYVTKDGENAKGVVVIQKVTLSSDKDKDDKVTTTTIETEANHTPKVVGVTPTAEKSETEGVQGAKQTSKAIFDKEDKDSSTLNFAKGSITINEGEEPKSVDLDMSTLTLLDGDLEVTTLVVKDKDGEVVGTYTVDKEKGEVVFQPVLSFVGVAPSVSVQIKDKNGTKVTTTYTPTVTELTLTKEDVVSSKVQGANQKGTPVFKEPTLPEGVTVKEKSYIFADGTTTKEVPNVGTYTINPTTGEVTFAPRGTADKPFEGTEGGVKVKATYTLTNEKGETTTVTGDLATYTPTVLPLKASGEDVVTENLVGRVHEKATIFHEPKLENGATLKGVEYTFEDGTTVKEVEKEGKYEISKDGKVTFTPAPNYNEKLQGVKVRATYTVVSENGFEFKVLADSNYLPVIKVAKPTSKDVTSIDARRKVQKGTPIFTPAVATVEGKEVGIPFDKNVAPVMVDEKGDEVKLNEKGEYVVVGEGKYTISAEGVVTFTPEDDFTGVAKGVGVRRVDEIGNVITAKYTPTVRPETTYISKDGEELLPPKDGTKEQENIPGYRLVDTKKDKEGNVVYVYEKIPTPQNNVVTRFVDKDGNEINPSISGKHGEQNITGYRFVETKVDKDGNIIHIYEKIATATPLSVKPSVKEEKITKSETSLPNTDAARTDEETAILTALGLLGIFGVYSRRKKH